MNLHNYPLNGHYPTMKLTVMNDYGYIYHSSSFTIKDHAAKEEIRRRTYCHSMVQ